jgi:hypothetical protein
MSTLEKMFIEMKKANSRREARMTLEIMKAQNKCTPVFDVKYCFNTIGITDLFLN